MRFLIFILAFAVLIPSVFANYEFNDTDYNFTFTDEFNAATDTFSGLCNNGTNVMISIDKSGTERVFSYDPDNSATPYTGFFFDITGGGITRGIWCNATHLFQSTVTDIDVWDISSRTKIADIVTNIEISSARGITGSPNGSFIDIVDNGDDDMHRYNNKAGYSYTGQAISLNEILGTGDHQPANFNDTFYYVHSRNQDVIGRYTYSGTYDNYNRTVNNAASSNSDWGWAINSSPNTQLGDIVYGWFANVTNERVYRYPMNLTAPVAAVQDTTPPEITSANLTSEGGEGQLVNLTDPFCRNIGCIVPRTNSTTPTFRVFLNEEGNVTVINLNRNLNYTDIYQGTANNGNGTGKFLVATLNTTNATRIGLWNFSLGAVDTSGNQNSTATFYFTINITDPIPPNVTIFAIPNTTVFGRDTNLTSEIQFNFTAKDNYDILISNCSLYIDYSFQKNATNVLNNSLYQFNHSYNSTASHTWSVNCTDSYNNKNGSQIFAFDIVEIPVSVNVTLFLNNTHANKSYEFNITLLDRDYGINLNISVVPNNSVCIDFDYFVNWTCPNTSTSIYFNLSELNITRFINNSISTNVTSNNILNNVIYQDEELSSGCEGFYTDCGNATDQNLSSKSNYDPNSGPTRKYYTVFENFTMPSNIISANLSLKYQVQGFQMNTSCFDGTDYRVIFLTELIDVRTNISIIPSQCLTGNILQINTKFNQTVDVASQFFAEYYEANVTFFRSISNVIMNVDNNTDLIKVAWKNKGFPNNGFPTNVSIDVDNDGKAEIIIPGNVQGNFIEVDEFITSLGANRRAQNFTYTSAGTNTLQANATSILQVQNFSMQLSSYSLDSENEVHVDYGFNFTSGYNQSFSQFIDSPLGVFDDFNDMSKNGTLWDMSNNPSNGEIIRYSDSTGSSSSTPTALTIQMSGNGDLKLEAKDNTALDLRNSSVFNALATGRFDAPCPSGNGRYKLGITDGTNNIEFYNRVGCGSESILRNITLIRKNSAGTLWDYLINGTAGSSSGSLDISSLDFTKQIRIRFYVSGSGGGTGTWIIHQVNMGGAWLNASTNNGTYKSNGNITICNLNETKTNVSRAILTWVAFIPTNTRVDGYLSNDCNSSSPIFINVQSGITHVFTTTGFNPGARFVLNSSVNTSSPVVRKFDLDIIKGAIRNVTVDCGADGDSDWNFPDELNSTTSPKVANCSISEFEAYRQTNCLDTLTCQYPISLTSRSAGILSVDNLNLTQSIIPNITSSTGELILSNLTKLESRTFWNWTVAFTNGILNFYDLDVEFLGSKNFTLFAHSKENSTRLLGTSNLTLQVYYSKFNCTFPQGISEYSLIYPEFLDLNQSNITIYGQQIKYCNSSVDVNCVHTSTPIYNCTSQGYDDSIDYYLYANSTINSTINESFDLGVNRTTAIQIKNATEKKIIDSLSYLSSRGIFSFVDVLNMTESKLNTTSWNYDFKFKAYCTKCVR